MMLVEPNIVIFREAFVGQVLSGFLCYRSRYTHTSVCRSTSLAAHFIP